MKRLNLAFLLHASDFKDSWTVLFQQSNFLSACLYARIVTSMFFKNTMMNMNFQCQVAKARAGLGAGFPQSIISLRKVRNPVI